VKLLALYAHLNVLQKKGGASMKSFGLVLSVLLLAGGSAVAQDVAFNFDKTTDFSKFKTYVWGQTKGLEELDPISAKTLESAIDAQLAAKGLTKTTGQADVLVTYQFAIGQERQVTSYDTGWGYGPGWGGRYGYGGYSGGMSTATTSTINIGQLVLDLYDVANKSLAWRGTAAKTLDTKAKPDKREKNINKAVAKLLKNYPPQKKS
jgi:Domain of unknown function (DUF4136)